MPNRHSHTAVSSFWKPGPYDAAGARAAEVFVNGLDGVPAQVSRTGLQRVLQLLALEVVAHLVGR